MGTNDDNGKITSSPSQLLPKNKRAPLLVALLFEIPLLINSFILLILSTNILLSSF